jgi:hypothetical protein
LNEGPGFNLIESSEVSAQHDAFPPQEEAPPFDPFTGNAVEWMYVGMSPVTYLRLLMVIESDMRRLFRWHILDAFMSKFK